MSQWKVILATLLIFGSGIGTGVLLNERKTSGKNTQSDGDRHSLRPIFFRTPGFLDRHLDLTKQQKEQVQSIMETSHEHIRELSTPFRNQLKEEQQAVQKALREVLTPEQAKTFNTLPRYRFLNGKPQPSGRPQPRRPGGSLAPPERNGTNKPKEPIEKQPDLDEDNRDEEALPDLKTI